MIAICASHLIAICNLPMQSITTTAKPRNILFVDNDKELIHAVQDYAAHEELKEKENLNFYFASNAKEALKKIASMTIDLVVLEIVLPVVNGYYLLQALRKDKKAIPVIVYTRLKSPQDLAKMAMAKVDNIFLKSLMKIEDLIQILIRHEDQKVELDKVLIELQSQVKSLAAEEIQTQLKIVQCPRCHMILAPNSRFCNNCGQKIVQPKAASLQASELAPESIKNNKI